MSGNENNDGGEIPVMKREIVQVNLKGAVVTKSEETKHFHIFKVPGWVYKIDIEAYVPLQTRAETLQEAEKKDGGPKYSPEEIKRWKEAAVLNKIKAETFAKHDQADEEKLLRALMEHLFEDEKLPKHVIKEQDDIDYIQWDTQKFVIRLKKKSWENKKAKWVKMVSSKKPDKEKLAQEEAVKFVTEKMKLKSKTLASEGEFEGYKKAMFKELFKFEPKLLDGQTLLEGAGGE